MGKDQVDIGSRMELLVDDWLIDAIDGAALELHHPVKREVVLTHDAPWEDFNAGCYSVILKDGNTYRLYYRGSCPEEMNDASAEQRTCLAVSAAGIHFERPSLGLIEANGSTDNNIVFKGGESHNFSPFIDRNPACDPAQRYKAVAGPWEKLYGLCSADGLHWRRIQKAPLEITGQFDSHNVAFWDELQGCYRSFSRYFDGGVEHGVRAIQSATSDDFIHWSAPVPHQYAPGTPREHLYTNATTPCPGAAHILLSFPKRFMPERKKIQDHPYPGLSDAVFMSSRDGVHWDRRFMEAWVRPGRDQRNWTERSNMPAWGIIQTSDDEFSMFISEHYRWVDCRLRRLTIRRHGFVSVNAGYGGGEFTTRPLTFSGKQLILNYATSVVGSVRVEVQEASGRPIAGYALDDGDPLYGDELDAAFVWREKANLAPLVGKPVRFRFVLKDADVFAIRTADPAP